MPPSVSLVSSTAALRSARLLACIATLGITSCHAPSESGGKRQTPVTQFAKPTGAEVYECTHVPWPTVVRSQGSLVADEESTVSAKVSGRVSETLVDLGDIVTTGDPLARLEMADFDLQIQQANAQLAETCAAIGLTTEDSESDVQPETIPFVMVEKAIWEESTDAMQRLKRLQKNNSVSQSEFDKQLSLVRVAKAKYESALRSVEEKVAQIRSRRVALAVAKQNMEDATVRAPFDGVVRRRHLAVGTFVQPGTSIMTVVRVNPLRFSGQIPERKSTELRLGQAIEIHIEGDDEPIMAKVERISPALDLASRSLRIEANVSNADGRYRSGLFAEGLVEVGANATTLAVPSTAVGEFAGVFKVWIVVGEKIEPQRVTIGRQHGALTEIKDGLSSGTTLLADFEVGDASRRDAGRATVPPETSR